MESLSILQSALQASYNLHNSKTKLRKRTLLYAAVSRTALRFLLLCLSEAARQDDVQGSIDVVPKIREVITKDLKDSKPEDGYDRLLLVFAHTVSKL